MALDVEQVGWISVEQLHCLLREVQIELEGS